MHGYNATDLLYAHLARLMNFDKSYSGIKTKLKLIKDNLGEEGLSKLADFIANPRQPVANLSDFDFRMMQFSMDINKHSHVISELYSKIRECSMRNMYILIGKALHIGSKHLQRFFHERP